MLPDPFRLLLAKFTMHASLIRHNLGGLVPPKIATPKLVVCTFFSKNPCFLTVAMDSLEVQVLALVHLLISIPDFQKGVEHLV